MRFRDRRAAGKQLAGLLRHIDLAEPLVLALPRGGVPVGHEIASALGAPLDVLVARKVGAPGHPEYGIGAIAEGGGVVVDPHALEMLGITDEDFARLADAERIELERRVASYRGSRPLPDLAGRDVVLVDDGLATGVTAEAAIQAIRSLHARRLVLAAPVCAPDTADRLGRLADEVVCVMRPEGFAAVGQWYERFDQTTDDEVMALLRGDAETARPEQAGREHSVTIRVAPAITLHGDLFIPPDPAGVIAFAHGTGSSRFSPRNRLVAASLQRRGFATLLLDLLTPEEEQLDGFDGRLRFDIGLLAERLTASADWILSQPDTSGLPLGYFGASTGAGAALVAAAQRPREVAAVVSRGGRPDLAGPDLRAVRAPTLLIVGGRDDIVLRLNEKAFELIAAERRMEIVPGATHLFPEPGALDRVAELAGEWFTRYVATPGRRRQSH
jgi:putative phosphoribosyl transferase